jgi:hypothetical protein
MSNRNFNCHPKLYIIGLLHLLRSHHSIIYLGISRVFHRLLMASIWLANYSEHLPPEYFRDASVGNLEDARDVAWPRTRVGQLDDLLTGRVRQRSPVDVDSTQLVDAAMPWMVKTKVSYRRALIITLGHFSSNISKHMHECVHPSQPKYCEFTLNTIFNSFLYIWFNTTFVIVFNVRFLIITLFYFIF